MRIFLLQEAMMAGPFILAMLVVGLVSIFLIFAIASKVLKLKEDIRELKKGDDEKELKEKRTKHFFLSSIILMVVIFMIMTAVKLFNIKFD